MRHISPEELIALHDANISRYGGLPGMSDPGRAEAIIGRVQARVAYEEITDLSKSPPPTWWLQREGIYSMMPISVPR